MSKRNFILLIIALVIATATALFFLSSPKTPNIPGEEDGGIFSNLNPFKNTNTPPNTTPLDNTNNTDNTIDIGNTEKMQLVKVSSMPVAGYTVFQKEIEIKKFAPALRYADRATGNIYQTLADQILEQKFSKTIIPKIYEAMFGNNGEVVIMRYLKTDGKTIQTYVGNLPTEGPDDLTTGDKEITGSFLPENITDLSVSLDGTSIFYLFNTGEGAIGVTYSLEKNTKVQIFDSPFTEWLSSYPNSKMVTINTKPSGTVPGYMYAINPSQKNIDKVLGNINGLTTLTSPNGKLTLYSDNGLTLNIYNTETKESAPIGLNTLAEKCVWNKTSSIIYCAVPKFINSEIYPDSWYMGEVSFSDEIWKINLENGNTKKIIDPITIIGGEDIDGTKLMLDDSENYLFFVNKKDSYLWKLNLK